MWLYGAAWVRAAFFERGTEEQVELLERGTWAEELVAGTVQGAGAGGWLASWVGGCKQLPPGSRGGCIPNQDLHGWHFFTE